MRKPWPMPCPKFNALAPGPSAARAPCLLLGSLALSGCGEGAATGASGSGLWWFASLALLGLALAGYFIGRLQERQRAAAQLFAAHSRQAAWLASLGAAAWRTDASHRFVAAQEPPPQEVFAAPPWAGDARLLPLLRAQRGFTDLRLQPAGNEQSAVAGWLLCGQPVLDPLGKFAGFVGTARALQDIGPPTAAATPPPQAPACAGGTATAAPAAAELAAARAESDEAYNFCLTVVHDLRAPVRVVDGFTRIVKEDYGHQLDRVANDHLERVLNAAARMNKMIDALLALAKLSNQPLTLQPVNLSQMAQFVMEELQRSQPAREVEVKIEDGLIAMGDPTLLRMVLENLLGNAWKYSSRTAKAQISLSTTRHGEGRAFVVRDNGAGFDMRSAEKLFGVFQRLHSASEFPGHGLGLVSARRIIRRHGGDIWAESEPARGASFSFTLP